ncbi:phage holin family protein [Paenibacillus sp. HN-1]|uniref:phage holin family protein n=1 Tax=Paenibacillus TaxID=44249 RepID=UPI001CA869DA|nr:MULTISPECIES: phage holin family protein [Paenibacillus]MBY9077292.1 phage holin family protein [Paenibacillus sp. CGMCC 1.18879]MBY9083339.1 phage holin family protein [Paenibacillus sinensis]
MESVAKYIIPVASVAASFFFGGWSALLTILLAFVILDYVTGVAAAAKEGKLKSNVGLWGIARKILIFAIVATAHLVDQALGGNHLFRDAAIFFYLSNELLSLIENAGRLDAPIPPGLRQAVEVLRGKSGDRGTEK